MFNILLQSHLAFLVHLDILSLMKNNYTLDSLRRVCKQKTEMYTTWQSFLPSGPGLALPHTNSWLENHVL